MDALLSLEGETQDQFLHGSIDQICNPNTESETKDLKASRLRAECESYFKNTIGQHLPDAEVLNDKQLGSLPAPLAAKVLAAVQARRSEVEAKLKSSATSFTLTTLEEFDWSLRLVMSAATAANVRFPVLLLRLSLSGQSQDITIELSKEDLDSFLQSCTDLSQAVQKLRI